MPTQPDLFDQPPGATPPVDPDQDALERFLKYFSTWMPAREIAARLDMQDRDIRAAAEKSTCIISGQRGYKHIDHATAEEISHFYNWMLSQGKKMIRRAIKTKRRAHAKIG